MRATPGRPGCPRLLGLRSGDSPLAGPGEDALLQLGLLLLSQLKFSFQLRPALHSPAPGRALRSGRASSHSAALSGALSSASF